MFYGAPGALALADQHKPLFYVNAFMSRIVMTRPDSPTETR